jgi:hypothetical protein
MNNNPIKVEIATVKGAIQWCSSQEYLSRTTTGFMAGIVMPPYLPGYGPEILEAQVRNAIGYLPRERPIRSEVNEF